ncbi:patatin-like phospholipase family protein [Pseudonocardia dioxanivorans]|uniref:patatin-like phospholipase family protein n=1 Tax=Pseudonocardia dioxanivorans TaxID=240495 RepID=UPI000CD0AA5D|nr:patatin-like phospholipase family protein [Pseudonocardia dioxanivorans]
MTGIVVHTLVLGAGGPVGAAWISGAVSGLAAGMSLRDVTQIVGTSAGSVVGAWLGAGADLDEATAAIADRAAWHAGRRGPAAGTVDTDTDTDTDTGTATGTAIDADAAAAQWARWLPAGGWPKTLRVTAVALPDKRISVWSADDGIPLGAAVAASTAAPGLAPPVRIGGRPHVDGGVRSMTNADVAASRIDTPGAEVLVLAPLFTDALTREVRILRGLGCTVRILTPERGDLGGALDGGGVALLGADLIGPAERAGRRQAERALAAFPQASTVGRFAG